MTFVSDRLRWMDEHHRLNGADVQIVYEGERAKLYPWDRPAISLSGRLRR